MKQKYIKNYFDELLIITINQKQFKILAKALDLIKKVDPVSYKKVLRCLKAIFVAGKKGKSGGVYEKERVWIDEGEFIENNPITYIASTIIHEAHHISQYLSGHKYKIPDSEISALNKQKKFLRKVDDKRSLDWLDKQLKREWWKDTIDNKKTVSKLDNYLDKFKEIKEAM